MQKDHRETAVRFRPWLGPTRHTLRGLTAICSALLVCVLLVGCATTKPYEREHLAATVMAPDDANAGREALHEHLLGIREGAVGGFGGGGGGCGCN